MPNIHDYVLWRGDLSFEERPFNEIDNLVLCQLAYIDLRTAFPVSASGQYGGTCPDTTLHSNSDSSASPPDAAREDRPDSAAVSVRNAIETVLRQRNQIDTLIIDGEERRDEYTAFARAAAASRRFGDLIMEDYVDIRDENLQTQFAAVTFRLDSGTGFVAFRGTDDSIIGWKEDFMISFTRVAAQDLALDYLRRHLVLQKVYVGGHSKGANLALYASSLLLSRVDSAGQQAARSEFPDADSPGQEPAAAMNRDDSRNPEVPFHRIPSDIRSRLLHVYVNDGPGLCEDVVDTSIIRTVDPITTRIVPEYDVIGKIFEMPIADSRIVRSSGSGVMQHGMITWQLKDGCELDLVPKNAPGSIWIGEVLDKWIGGVEPQEREIFVNELFAILSAGGNDTFSGLSDLGPEGLEKIIAQAAGTNPVTWDVAASLPRAAAIGVGQKEHRSTIQYLKGLFHRGTYSRGMALVAAGLACMALPARLFPLSLNVVIIGLILYEILYLFRRLRASQWQLSSVQIPFFILLFSLAAWFVITVKENALMLISNLLYGGVFLFLSYRSFSRIGRDEDPPSGSRSTQSRSVPEESGNFAAGMPGDEGRSDRRDAHGSRGNKKRSLFRRAASSFARNWNLVEGIFLLLLAAVMLTAPFDVVAVCTFILGVVLVIDGIIHLISVYRVRRNA